MADDIGNFLPFPAELGDALDPPGPFLSDPAIFDNALALEVFPSLSDTDPLGPYAPNTATSPGGDFFDAAMGVDVGNPTSTDHIFADGGLPDDAPRVASAAIPASVDSFFGGNTLYAAQPLTPSSLAGALHPPVTPVTPFRPSTAADELKALPIPPLPGGGLPETRAAQQPTAVKMSPISPGNGLQYPAEVPMFELPPNKENTCAPGEGSARADMAGNARLMQPLASAGRRVIDRENVSTRPLQPAARADLPMAGSMMRQPVQGVLPVAPATPGMPIASAGAVNGRRYGGQTAVGGASRLSPAVGKVDFKGGRGRVPPASKRKPKKRAAPPAAPSFQQPVFPRTRVAGPSGSGLSGQAASAGDGGFVMSPALYQSIFGSGGVSEKRNVKRHYSAQPANVIQSVLDQLDAEIDNYGKVRKLKIREELRKQEEMGNFKNKDEKKRLASRREAEVTRVAQRARKEAMEALILFFVQHNLHRVYGK